MDGKGGLGPKELDALRLLSKHRLLPRELSDLSGLNLAETLDLVTSLIRAGFVSKMSDGFSSFLYITDRGNAAVNNG